jgi:hypothetical protein
MALFEPDQKLARRNSLAMLPTPAIKRKAPVERERTLLVIERGEIHDEGGLRLIRESAAKKMDKLKEWERIVNGKVCFVGVDNDEEDAVKDYNAVVALIRNLSEDITPESQVGSKLMQQNGKPFMRPWDGFQVPEDVNLVQVCVFTSFA